jgi:hypothetical protein
MPTQVAKLYQALYQHIAMVSYYLDRLVFPQHLKVFKEKSYSNGYDLSGMVVDTTKGFSATLQHNRLVLPENIGIHARPGIDGMMLYVLSQSNNRRVLLVDFNDDKELLGKLDLQEFRMFVDAEGYIQHMNNREVATFLLSRAPEHIQGTIYIDDFSQKIVVIMRSGEVKNITECNIPPRLLLKYINHDNAEGTDVPQALIDVGVVTKGPKTIIRRNFQSKKRLRFLDIYGNQSVAELIRTSDAKQVLQLLNLPLNSEITSIHTLRWDFAHTVAYLTEQFQATVYQRMHAVIRQRAYQLLLGKYTYDHLPQSLDDVKRNQLWENLHDNILDEFDRVRHEVKVQHLQGFDYLSIAVQRELQTTLTNLYRYRKKQNGLETIGLCFDAFSEKVNHLLTDLVPLDVCEDTSEIIGQAAKQLKLYYAGILLEVDNKAIDIIVEHAKQYLPKWTITKQLFRVVERERQEAAHYESHAKHQNEQESEKEKQAHHEKVSHSYRLFNPVPQVGWHYQQLISELMQQMICRLDQSGSATKRLCLYPLCQIIPLPFSQQVFLTENFMRTETGCKALEQFAKNILYYLEIQEGNAIGYVLLDMHEAEYIKVCLNKKLFDSKAIGIRTLSGALISCSAPFRSTDVPEMLHVQLLYLNGATENEIPSRLVNTWRTWKTQSGQENLTKYSEQFKIALAK